MIDNSAIIAPFCPERDDGDSFIYTEMLDRSKRKGNNGVRLVKAFYHRSRDEFWEQWPTIQKLCDLVNVRACTRIAMRSYKSVGREFTRLVVETALTENWQGMKSLYQRAAGIVKPSRRLWLFDVDEVNEQTEAFGKFLASQGDERGCYLVATIPSRKGLHYITNPFRFDGAADDGYVRGYDGKIQLHKDNPTNLYIPEGAA